MHEAGPRCHLASVTSFLNLALHSPRGGASIKSTSIKSKVTYALSLPTRASLPPSHKGAELHLPRVGDGPFCAHQSALLPAAGLTCPVTSRTYPVFCSADRVLRADHADSCPTSCLGTKGRGNKIHCFRAMRALVMCLLT